MQNVVFSISDIIERLKQVRGHLKDADLARELGVLPKKLGVWKIRNTIPLEELTTFCRRYGYNLDWALTGEGRQRVIYPDGIQEPIVLIDEPEISLYPEYAKKLRVFLEKMNEDQVKDVLKYAEERIVLAEAMKEKKGKAG